MEEKKKRIKKSDILTLKWIYSICKSEKWKILTIVLVNIVLALLTIVYANFSKNIINAAVMDKSFQKVLFYAGGFAVLILVQLGLNMLASSTTERCKGKLEWKLKQYMLESMLQKDYACITAYHTGELQNRLFNDITVISDGFTSILPNTVLFVTRLLCAFGYLVVIDKIFALAFFVGGIVVFFCTQLFRKTLKRLHKEVQKTEGKTRSFIQEAITSLLVIKAFVAEEQVSRKTEELQAVNYRAKMKRRFFGVAANAGISMVFHFGYVFALGFGAYRLIHGLDYGTVTAMLQLVNQIQAPFAALSAIMPKYFALLASAERLMEIDALPEEPKTEEQPAIAPLYQTLQYIDFENITFRYDRDVILENTSLRIEKGDFAAIAGISGIGKSTLLKLLLGVFQTESGTITLQTETQSVPVNNYTRRLFSYVPQGNFLLSGTIRENLTFINKSATEEAIYEALRIACADTFIRELPKGIDTLIGERGIGLSEGQLQRLAIARSLLSESPIMLLDEATSALDEATEKQFLTNLRALKNKTCIIVSHKQAAQDICNKHIQIADGKIISEEI